MGDFNVFLCSDYENVNDSVPSLTFFFAKLHQLCLWKI